MACSMRTSHGRMVWTAKEMFCDSIFENVARSRSPIMCGGTRKMRQISVTWNLRVSRNCAASLGMLMGVKVMDSSRMATLPELAEPP